jgi:hypothetical protein
MSDLEEKDLELLRRREMLRDVDALSALSVDDLLELASQVTEVLRLAADVAKEKGLFRTAATLYDEIATAWQNAGTVVPPEVQPHFESLVRYWQSRGNEVLEASQLREIRPIIPAKDTLGATAASRDTTYQAPDTDDVAKIKPVLGPGDSQEISKSFLNSYGNVKGRKAFKNSDWSKK